MALSPTAAQNALIAFQRFGFGATPGGPARIGNDPKAALRTEVEKPGIAAINNSTLPTYGKACAESQKVFARSEDFRVAELNARVDKHMSAEIGFVERLVVFWSNHFSMSVNKAAAVRGTIGQWERDVVRRHVLGRFSNMLQDTYTHPAMIAFLDNQHSIGPNTVIGTRAGFGFNENLAREIMELHTLGSGGGYSEADVTAFAKILTGWSYVRDWEADGGFHGANAQNRGRFIYRGDWHEPGPHKLMGKSYPAIGQKQAEHVFEDLAAHPATAEHIAYKLVRHFITDQPTPAMVNPLKQKFLQTDGNLKAVSLALLDLPEAWSTPLVKFRTPYEHIIAQYRALGVRHKSAEPWALANPLTALGQMQWESSSPEGYSDETPTWLNPDSVRVRLDMARFSSMKFAADYQRNVLTLGLSLFDSALSQATRDRIVGIADGNKALTILFASPEFQRR
jgi:uncharacterized protein (DUF1800 family)